MRTFLTAILLTLFTTLSVYAQNTENEQVRNEVLRFEAGAEFYFNNTEYADCGIAPSITIFNFTITPTLTYSWNEKHKVGAGALLQTDFGSKNGIDATKLIAYYRFQHKGYGVTAGVFERNQLIGNYSYAFFSDAYLHQNPLVQGIALRHQGERSHQEFVFDWFGKVKGDQREKFRILLSLCGQTRKYLYGGVSLMVEHFANSELTDRNVVDNMIINPYGGVRFNAFFNFDIRLGYIQTMQRDRHNKEEGWKTPMGAELTFKMERWGAYISNNLYVGRNLCPLYNRQGTDEQVYGDNLYALCPLYAAPHKIYNRTAIGYHRSFWGENLTVFAEMVFQHIGGSNIYTQQLVGISARLNPTIYDKEKHKRK